jgi:hypothetical protein
MAFIQTTLFELLFIIIYNYLRHSSKILVPEAEYNDEKSPLRELQRS